MNVIIVNKDGGTIHLKNSTGINIIDIKGEHPALVAAFPKGERIHLAYCGSLEEAQNTIRTMIYMNNKNRGNPTVYFFDEKMAEKFEDKPPK